MKIQPSSVVPAVAKGSTWNLHDILEMESQNDRLNRDDRVASRMERSKKITASA